MASYDGMSSCDEDRRHIHCMTGHPPQPRRPSDPKQSVMDIHDYAHLHIYTEHNPYFKNIHAYHSSPYDLLPDGTVVD